MKSPKRASSRKLVFVVPTPESQKTASVALGKVHIPEAPELESIKRVQSIGELLLQKLKPKSIKIVVDPSISHEESYETNVKTFNKLVTDRDQLAFVVDKMIQPLAGVMAKFTLQLSGYARRLADAEDRLSKMEEMLREVYGQAPSIPPTPSGKTVWNGKIKEAAYIIRERHDQDLKRPIRYFKDIRDSSDQFHDEHIFRHKPGITKDQLYENVKRIQL